MICINYSAEPTAALFHGSAAFVRGLMGPIGSGKSVACVMEVITKALLQEPDDNGVRRTRWAIIRNTYPELKKTTVKTWLDWAPEPFCKITYDAPITAKIRKRLPDGTLVDAEVLFISLDLPKDVRKLLSLELTGAFINEAREINKEFLDMLTGRVGRFPAKKDGGPTWSGIIMDTNPPDDDHWWYQMAEVQQPEGWEFFRQPGALIKKGELYIPNPEAENIQHQPLGFGYWLRQIAGKTVEWIKVYVLGEYGTVVDGKPVYPEYSDHRHVAKKPLEPMKGLPLVLAWDFGLTPACVFMQCSPKGQLVVLDELQAMDMGITQFARDVVKPYIANRFPGMVIQSTGDPAGNQRAQTDEKTCLQILAEAGLRTTPAKTNSFTARREAVAGFLIKALGDDPGFILDPRCKRLRKGFNGAYQFERVQVSGERYADMPKKDVYSHSHDALQYGAMHLNPTNTKKGSKRQVKQIDSGGWT